MIKLIQGDCLERMKEIESGSIDMVLADPPYGTTACKWDSIIPLEPMWEQLKRVIKPNGALVLFGSEPFSSALRMSNIKQYKYDWVWEKDKGTNFAISNKQPLRKTENISVFYKKQPDYNSQGEKLDKPYRHTLPISKSDSSKGAGKHNLNEDGSRKYAVYTHSKKHNLIYCARDNGGKGKHPTQKPVALMEYLIKTYTNEGEAVLDFTMGSGTTGVAAKNLNRDFIGIELDETYFNIAKDRIND
jgi:site-specific DNA-methyltransferase (adenine-specific)